jgi:hypothetical protein
MALAAGTTTNPSRATGCEIVLMRYRSGSSLVHKITGTWRCLLSLDHNNTIRLPGSRWDRTKPGYARTPLQSTAWPPSRLEVLPRHTQFCRTLSEHAGNDDDALHIGGRRRKSAPRHEVAGSWAHGYGDLIFAPVREVGAMPARGDLDGVSKGEECNRAAGGEADAENESYSVRIYVTTDIAASVTAKLHADYQKRRIITHPIIDPVTAHAQVPAMFDTGVHWPAAEVIMRPITSPRSGSNLMAQSEPAAPPTRVLLDYE